MRGVRCLAAPEHSLSVRRVARVNHLTIINSVNETADYLDEFAQRYTSMPLTPAATAAAVQPTSSQT